MIDIREVHKSCILTFHRYDYLIQACDLQQAVMGHGLTPIQKKFVDSVNGKSGLTYFDALESEVRNHMTLLQKPATNVSAEQKHISDRDCVP